MKILVFFVFILNLYSQDKLKYSPNDKPLATRLYRDNTFLKKNKAPDFWSLNPYYIAQFNDYSCSVASVVMLVNAARVDKDLKEADKLYTQKGLLEAIKVNQWKERVNEGGYNGEYGLTLIQLKEVIEAAFKALNLEFKQIDSFKLEDDEKLFSKTIEKILEKNEESNKDFIIAHFVQGAYTNSYMGGHISPVGAYDKKNKKVLIFDVDREWYEPYWVNLDTFVNGIKQSTEAHGPGGIIWVKL